MQGKVRVDWRLVGNVPESTGYDNKKPLAPARGGVRRYTV